MARKGQPRIQNRRHMARQQREQIQNNFILYATYGIIGLVLVLVIYGFISTTYIQPNQPVAIVNGTEISTRDFQTRVKYNRYQLLGQWLNLQLQAGTSLGPEFDQFLEQQVAQIDAQLNPVIMGEQVISDMIADQLIRQEADALGITVTDEEIDTRMAELYGYYDGGYAPTPTTFPTALPTSTLSPLQLSLVTPVPPVEESEEVETEPTEEVEDVATEEPTEEPPAEPTATPQPTATALSLEGYQERRNTFIEQINVFFAFTNEDLRSQVESILYREKLTEYLTADISNTEEQLWARHILVSDLDTANQVLDRLQNGEAFSDLAAEYSIDTGSGANGGELGWFGRGRMVPEFEVAVYELEIGEISEPTETQFGFHIIQLLGREDRVIVGDQLTQAKATVFSEWLTETLAANVETIERMDYWEDRIPDTPTQQDFITQYTVDSQNAQATAQAEAELAATETDEEIPETPTE